MSKRKKHLKQQKPIDSQKTKELPKPSKFLGFDISDSGVSWIVLMLVIISVITKFCVIYLTTSVGSFVDYYDISYYAKFASYMAQGQMPYVDFTIDYPQGILFTVLVPYIATLFFGISLPIFALADQAMMTIFDAGTVILIYLIGLKIYDKKRAFAAAFLYATAISAAYFVLTKYDAFPTFLLMLSITFYIYGKDTKSYLASALAFLAKWFPAVAIPYFIVNDIKEGKDKRSILKNIGYAVVLVAVVFLPFIIMSPSGFVDTYTVNANVPTLAHGFIYYLDFIFNTTFFGDISLILMALGQIVVLALYYRQPKKDSKTLIAYIMFAIFAFIIFNRASSPQHLQWLAPFLALFLVELWDFLLFYLIQIILYMEFPLAYGNYYDNTVGYGASNGVFGATTSIIIFTLKYLLLFIVVIIIAREVNEKEPDKGILVTGTTGSDKEKPDIRNSGANKV